MSNLKCSMKLISVVLACLLPLSAFAKDYADPVTIAGNTLQLVKANGTEDWQVMQDDSRINSAWSNNDPNPKNYYRYRFYYAKTGQGETHNNCDIVKQQGRIFPGSNGDDSYTKGKQYNLKNKEGDKYDKGTTTVCVVKINTNSDGEISNGTYIFLGSIDTTQKNYSDFKYDPYKLKIKQYD